MSSGFGIQKVASLGIVMLPDSDEVGNTLLPQDVSGGHVHYSTTVRQDVDANAAVTAVSTSEYLGRAPRNSRFLSTARELAGEWPAPAARSAKPART